MTLEHIGPAANSADRGYFAGLVVAGLNEVQNANAIDITPEAVFAARNVHLANGHYPGVDRSLDKHSALSNPTEMLRLLIQQKVHGYQQKLLRSNGPADLRQKLDALFPSRRRSALLLGVGTPGDGRWIAVLDQQLVHGVRSWIIYDTGLSAPPFLTHAPCHDFPRQLMQLRIRSLIHRPSDTL